MSLEHEWPDCGVGAMSLEPCNVFDMEPGNLCSSPAVLL